jgi:mono/diheme cytochrome c family protein
VLFAVATAAGAALATGCGSVRAPHPRASALFSRSCGACHSLTGVDDPRRQGGDLLHFHSTRTQLRQLAGEMPVRRPLSRPQLEAVVDYVMSVERNPGHTRP